MTPRPYADSDLPTLAAWFEGWGLDKPTSNSLPDTGLVVDGVAAGFLYLTNAQGLALLDAYISNPQASKRDRALALDAITVGLMSIAKSLGYWHVIAITRNGCVQSRARRHGFRDAGRYAIMSRTEPNRSR